MEFADRVHGTQRGACGGMGSRSFRGRAVAVPPLETAIRNTEKPLNVSYCRTGRATLALLRVASYHVLVLLVIVLVARSR